MTKWEFLAEVENVVRLLFCEYNGRFYFRPLGGSAAIVATDSMALELAKRKVRVIPDNGFEFCYRS